jgi:hypothetical protein
VRLKSLYIGTLAAMVGILTLSFLVFHQISDRMQKMTIDPTFERADELQLESARGMYESADRMLSGITWLHWTASFAGLIFFWTRTE